MNRFTTPFLAAQFFSILGSAVSSIALPWLLISLAIEPQRMAGILGIHATATVFAVIVGSPFLDRLNKRRFCIWADLLLATGLCALIHLYLSGSLHWIQIAIYLASSAFVATLAGAAGSSMIPALAKVTGKSNAQMNGAIGSFHNFGDLLGPVASGLLIASVGIGWALTINASTFLISSLFLLLLVPAIVGVPDQNVPRLNDKNAFIGGILAIASNPTLRWVTLVSAVVNMCVTPLLSLLLPLITKQSGDDALSYGTMISCFGCGAFVASLAYTWRGSRAHPLRSMFISLLIAAAAFISIPMLGRTELLLALFVIGASVGYLGPLEQTLVQDHARPEVLGSVLLAYTASRTALVPVGFALAGGALAREGIAMSFLILAIVLGFPAGLKLLRLLMLKGPHGDGDTRSE